MKLYSMNHRVYYKLTEKGKEIWEENNRFLNERVPSYHFCINYIGNDWVADTLWSCFERFGNYISAGTDVCIYDITFENPLEENNV